MLEVIKKYFAINLSDYENMNFSLEINKVVLGVCIAMIVGVVLLNIYRGNGRLLVMQLTRHGATSENEAKTLGELGLANSRAIKKILSGGNVIAKTVTRIGAVKYDYETYVKMDKKARAEAERIDFESARFYIAEEPSTRAAFIIERYATSLSRTIASCVLVTLLCGCVIGCMPAILSAVDTLLGSVGK